VKHLWEYIKGNDLQNPSNKREIMCDDGLRGVFGCDKIDMFRMNKVLGMYVDFLLFRALFLSSYYHLLVLSPFVDGNMSVLTLFLLGIYMRMENSMAATSFVH
jgi:hypothetical protein